MKKFLYTPFFDDICFTNCAEAYEKQIIQLKWIFYKSVCTVIALIGTIIVFLCTCVINVALLRECTRTVFLCLFLAGYAATLLGSFEAVWNVFSNSIWFGWHIIPIPLIDLVSATVAFLIFAILFSCSPVTFCVISLWQSFDKYWAAKKYLRDYSESQHEKNSQKNILP